MVERVRLKVGNSWAKVFTFIRFARLGFKLLVLHGVKKVGDGWVCACGQPDCQSPGKHPWTKHGVHDATMDEEKIYQWQRAEAGLGRESIAVAGVLTIGLAYSGYSLSFSSVPLWAFLVAVAAPLTVWVSVLPPSRKLGGWKVVTFTTLITLVISGIAVVGAFIAWRADSANDSYF